MTTPIKHPVYTVQRNCRWSPTKCDKKRLNSTTVNQKPRPPNVRNELITALSGRGGIFQTPWRGCMSLRVRTCGSFGFLSCWQAQAQPPDVLLSRLLFCMFQVSPPPPTRDYVIASSYRDRSLRIFSLFFPEQRTCTEVSIFFILRHVDATLLTAQNELRVLIEHYSYSVSPSFSQIKVSESGCGRCTFPPRNTLQSSCKLLHRDFHINVTYFSSPPPPPQLGMETIKITDKGETQE